MAHSTDLTPIALTQDDIMLIQRALRLMSEQTGFSTIRDDSRALIDYIERENENAKITISEFK